MLPPALLHKSQVQCEPELFESQYELLAKERVRELKESQNLILFYQFESPTQEELEGIKEDPDEIDESEYVILEDYKEEDLSKSAMLVPSKTDTEIERKNSIEKIVSE